MDCANLKSRFRKRYRVEYEESYYADRGDGARAEEPELMIMLCKYGQICPWGNGKLAACTDRPGKVVGRLKALPFTSVAQDGDDGANIVFPVEHFDEVAKIMKPRRRRQGRPMSPEERQRLILAGRKYRFGTGRQVQESGAAGHAAAQMAQ